MQDSGTIAGLRGIDSVDGTVAWASGTGGTVLRTPTVAQHWQKCAIPDGDRDGASLDFRGVQAFDANAAFIMSSGKGRLSRLYKTKDGCKTWKLIFVNPDKDGFWDAIYFGRRHEESNNGKIPWRLDGWLLGDPVQGRFSVFSTANSGVNWFKQKNKGLEAEPATQGAFAASNSSLITFGGAPLFGSGGSGGGFVFDVKYLMTCLDCTVDQAVADRQGDRWDRTAFRSAITRNHPASSPSPFDLNLGLLIPKTKCSLQSAATTQIRTIRRIPQHSNSPTINIGPHPPPRPTATARPSNGQNP